ncbi:hypothetical protein [Streptomyces sp. NPDC058373]|uniref:hypothetical protein n=1 Tax=Streptomyces sp. NPDC058373 TaxID=3346465 RepID=UPI003659B355
MSTQTQGPAHGGAKTQEPASDPARAQTPGAAPPAVPAQPRPAVALDGVPAEEGLALLAEHTGETAGPDPAGLLSALSGFPAPERAGRGAPWARPLGRPLSAAEVAVRARAADKVHVLELLRAAGVAAPDPVVVPAEGRRPAAAYWRDGWTGAVLQRRAGGLAGRGTVPVGDARELAAALDAWPGEALRLTRLVPGLSLTVSACVGGDRTVVSALAHRLVGLPELTPGWGTHCGDQLIGPGDLPGGRYARVREAAHAVGEVLRERGFRGAFGLDLLLDGDAVLAVGVESGPRPVSALVQAAEHAAGLLPAPGLELLARLLPALPATRPSTAPVPHLSHLVVHASRPARLTKLPSPGRYRLGRPGPEPVGVCAPPEPADDEALWWPQAAPGPVAAGDELLLMRFGRRVCPLEPRPPLGPTARAWRDSAARALGGTA